MPSVPRCPHCDVPMKIYETIHKADGPYGRYRCPTLRCPNCKGRCVETRGQPL